MEAISPEFRTGYPWKPLSADDLVIVAESHGELKARLKNWKDGLEEKGPQGKRWEDKSLVL